MTDRWYVVHSQPNGEAKAAFNLRRQGFTAYLPRCLKTRRHARRTEHVPTPLFPRYLFVEFDPASRPWRCILSTVGVASLICHAGLPAPVPMGVVEELMDREDGDGYVALAGGWLKAGDTVALADGPLAGCRGLVLCASDKERVDVLLQLLGRQLEIEVPAALLATAP